MYSISDSEYRQACKDIILSAVARPTMWYTSLSELEAFLRGHEFAFCQLATCDHKKMFHSSFCDWLFTHKALSCASGWAYAIEEFSAQSGRIVADVFLYVSLITCGVVMIFV